MNEMANIRVVSLLLFIALLLENLDPTSFPYHHHTHFPVQRRGAAMRVIPRTYPGLCMFLTSFDHQDKPLKLLLLFYS